MKNLDKLLEKVVSYLETGEFFLKKNMPEFVEQTLNYYIWSEEADFYFMLSFASLFLLGAIISLFKSLRDTYSHSDWVVPTLLSGILFIIFSLFTFDEYKDLRKIELSPEL